MWKYIIYGGDTAKQNSVILFDIGRGYCKKQRSVDIMFQFFIYENDLAKQSVNALNIRW